MLRDETTETIHAGPAPSRGPGAAVEPPLDPAIERVRARLQRLMLVGIGTLMVGVLAIAVVASIRANRAPDAPIAGGDVALPVVPGASLQDASLAPNGLLLRFAMPDGTTQLVVLDPATGAPRLRVRLDETNERTSAN